MFQNSSLFLDKSKSIEKLGGGNLPHWHQDGKLQYVTFRLGDALPLYRVREIKDNRQRFEKKYPRPWDNNIEKEYWRLFGNIEDELLHAWHGECILRNPGIRRYVRESLHFGDGKKYYLWAYVIMPNHVHGIFQPIEDEKIDNILGGIKGYSAKLINKYIGRTGKLWQRESFDRIIRCRESLGRNIEYIRENPRFLRSEEYDLYLNFELINGV